MADFKLNEGERLLVERRTATFRKEEFEYVHVSIIDENGDSWTTTGMDEANYNQIYNQYRERHGLPFPDEISALRKHYDLSAAKMSEILGFGTNQYRLYENGEIPSVSNARVLMAIREKQTFMDYVESSKVVLGEKEYKRLVARLSDIPQYERPMSLPTAKSGFVSKSIPKIAATVHYFIAEMGGVFKTKMNKLLFYADFLSYRRRGYGITGLEYKALPYGPVPCDWNKIYSSIEDVDIEEYKYSDGNFGELLMSENKPDMSAFGETELSVLREVAERFRHVSSGAISDISHKEKGWLENRDTRGYIDYSYAFELSD